MVSRISNPILTNTALRNLQTSLRQLQTTQEILATGLRIRRPSDDPLGTATALRLRAEIIEINRYISNIDRAESFVTATEGALGIMNEVLLELREITVTEANAAGNASSRAAAATEVNALIEQLVQTANSDFGGRYIFAGFETETIPFVRTDGAVQYRGNDGIIFEEIGPGNLIPVNIPGNVAFSRSIGEFIGDLDLNPNIGITVDTKLAHLNSGAGVQPGRIVITDGTGASASIDLSLAVTIGDVMAAINAAAGIDVTASVNSEGTGLLITDDSGGAGQLQIAEAGGTTAGDLGIVGSSMGSISGTDLDPTIEGSAVTSATPLAALNFGAGVDMTAASFIIMDRDSNTATISIAGLTSVGDVVTAINSAGINVTASIAADGSGIDLTDTVSTGRSQITVTEAGGTTAADLGLLGTGFGSTLYGARLDPAGPPLYPAGPASTPVALLNGAQGVSLGTIRITNGELSASIDLTGAVTVGNVLAAIERAGVRVDATIDSAGQRLVITSQIGDTPIIIFSDGATDTAEELGLFAPGLFETAEEVRQALLNNDPERLTQLIGDIDEVIARTIANRAGSGEQLVQTGHARSRLQDLELSFETLRSKTEDADLIEFAIALVNQETIYQAALETTISVIQPTIFSFLR